MRVDPNGNLDWGTVLDFAITIGAGSAGFAVGTISGLKTYRNGVLSGKGHIISALEGLSVGVLSGAVTFGAINNTVNAFYYNFISDGESDLNNSSYNIDNSGFKYLNRWDRLDYTKKCATEMYGEKIGSTYNLHTWMYYSEYNFHMYAWKCLKGMYSDSPQNMLESWAYSASDAHVDRLWEDSPSRYPIYFIVGLLGL